MRAPWKHPGDFVYACQHRRDHQQFWRVLQRQSNHSAFNGYHYTPSRYSEISCETRLGGCGARWRTKAAYVDELPDEVLA